MVCSGVFSLFSDIAFSIISVLLMILKSEHGILQARECYIFWVCLRKGKVFGILQWLDKIRTI